jgi:hypothetical protein
VGNVVLIAAAIGFAVCGIVWLVRMALVLRKEDDAPAVLWLLVFERGAAWVLVGLALGLSALGHSAGHWLFLGAAALVVVESIVWRTLLPKLAGGLLSDRKLGGR